MFANPKRSYGPFVGLDFVFIALGLVGGMMLFESGIDGADAIAAVANPWIAGLVMVVLVAVLSTVAVLAAKLDQRMNDEFVYKALTNGAVAAMMVGLLVHLAFDILPLGSFGMGGLSTQRLMGVLTSSWSFGYAVNRIGGTTL